MNTTLIVVVAVIVLVPLALAIMFKVLWKVPAADQALIVTGLGASGASEAGRTFKIVTGGGDLVRLLLVEQAELGVHAGGGALDAPEPADHRQRDALTGYGEVGDGLGGLAAPQLLSRGVLHAHGLLRVIFGLRSLTLALRCP